MLTDASIRRLTPRAAPYRVFERGEIPGFGVSVSPGGTRSFFVQHTHGGKRRFFALGVYPVVGLALARERARELLKTLERGDDPRAAQPATMGTLEALLAAWLTHQRDAGRRNVADTERMMRANIPAALLARAAARIQPADIRAVLAPVHERGARVLANRLRAHLHAMFQYGIRADHDPRRLSAPVMFGVAVNPVAAIPRDEGAEQPGERVLSWGEVRALWHSETLTWPARQACRLLLATGARVNEIVGAAWEEFDLDAGTWTLPANRAKNHRANVLPVTPIMAELLAELRSVWPDSPALFPARNASHAKVPWGITALSHAVRKAGMDWAPRDLRRTFKTLAAGAGIGRDILDRIQNHARQDVASRHYDRYEYLPEKRAALGCWHTELAARGAGDNVVPLRKPPARSAGRA